MNSKQKMLAAMTSGLDTGFPVVIPYVGLYLRDHWEEVTDQPWWTFQSPDLTRWLKVEEDLQQQLNMDWVECRMCASTNWRTRHRVETFGSSVCLVDNETGGKEELQRPPIGGKYIPVEQESLIRSVDDLERLLNFEGGREPFGRGNLEYVRMAAEKYGSERFLCAIVGSPFGRLVDYFGFTEMMTELLRRPKFVQEVLQRLIADTKEQLRAYAAAGLHGIFLEEVFSSANEISIEAFNEFVVPSNQDVISEIRRLGMKSIYYPCGNMTDRLELVIREIEPDCLSLEEGKKGFEVDIAKIDEAVAGRLCIFGNLDSVWTLQNGTREELRREIVRFRDVGRRHGKFVMSLGSPVTPQTSITRLREYVTLARHESQ